MNINIRIHNNQVSNTPLLEPITHTVDAIASTMGPGGNRVVIMTENGEVKVTRDGVTVAKFINYKKPMWKLAAKFINQAANSTNDLVGDGTTTACVLTGAMLKNGMQYINAFPRGIERGIEKAAQIVEQELQAQKTTIPLEHGKIAPIAKMSANDDSEIGDRIAEAILKVGENGIVTIEESKVATKSQLDVVNGMRFDRGYISRYFVTNFEKNIAELDNPYVLVYNKKISNLSQILSILEGVAQSNRALLIIAEDVEGEALTALWLNHLQKKIKVCAVKAPGFGDRRDRMLEDIALLTNTQVINDETFKLGDAKVDDLGSAGKIHITKDHTTIVDCNPNAEELENRINIIKSEIKECTSDYEKEKLQERLAKLAGGIAAIRVGGTTEIEVKERKERYDDALHATKAAIEEGVVVGGGCALLYSYKKLEQEIANEQNENEKVGMRIVLKSLKAPITQILKNSELEASVIINKLLEDENMDQIFDAQAMQYVNAQKNGILDPLKVVRIAFRDAVSTASIVLTSHSLILPDEEDDKKDDSSAGAGMGAGMNPYGGMGGMDY